MRVAAYIRVSTQMQVEEGYSLSAQKERLKAFAFSQNWEIVQFYVDEGISAKDMERPELKRMLEGVKEKLFDIVLVYKLDRLTRSVIDLDRMLKIFSDHEVMFKSATEVYDTTTATGRLFIRLVASMAQWERENLGERVRMGMDEKAREGKWVINLPPYGYEKDGDYLKIIESEAAVVRKIYEMYMTGKYGIAKIARLLNEEDLTSKKNNTWQYNTVSYILRNPLYIGTMRYNYRVNKEQYFEIENAVPAIIDEVSFQRVQAIINSRKTKHPRSATSKFIFTGVLRCSRCGGCMAGKYSISKRGDKKYHSYNYYCHNSKFGSCDQPLINQNYLEHQFLNRISHWNLNKEVNEAIIEDKKSVDNTDSIANINKEIEEIKKRRSKWQYAWVNEMISDEDFKKRTNEENKKEKMLLEELEALTKIENPIMDNYNIVDILSDIQLNWSNLEIHEKKQLVHLTFKTISVNKIKKLQKPESVEIVDFDFL
ncbi:recombinase family protein [Cytobacillus solani]|uniref:Resolvase n=1 Tax=Cytobacillus solani TaxID=1637975 RepID=A0A0Q3VHJ6_9BACI|nr:recombinase family protein [Cytobacillus solani]KQL20506.1 hypothetical protein AN957_19230 [Cytobacillus solani]